MTQWMGARALLVATLIVGGLCAGAALGQDGQEGQAAIPDGPTGPNGESPYQALARNAAPIPDGFRAPPYQGLTPDHLPGAQTLTVPQAEALYEQGVVFIDVSPASLGTFGASKGQWVLKADHETIAGALWLPNVGEHSPAAWVTDWFRAHLERISKGDRATPIVLFCRPDCWMSWNAGRRAVQWGYQGVYWFRGGIPAWRDSLLPVEFGHPEPAPNTAAGPETAPRS